jgi:type IV secretory pathway VirB4 component
MGNFMTQRFERGARQIIIDVGGTYKNLMESLVGMNCYFEYEPDHPLSFNPFLLEKREDAYLLSSDKVNFLTALLSTIWKGTHSAIPLTPAERAIFVRIIPAYYAYLNENRKEKPSMKGFYYWFKKQDQENRSGEEYRSEMQFFNVAQFLVVLKPFVEGEYRDVLNAEREIDISHLPLVCFDMAKVKSDPGLYPVVSMLITELALDQVRKFPSDQKYIYMDEAWSMLSDSMGDWVESMYRTIRKNNGSMCIITQGIDEIIESAVGSAIIANAQTQIILNHTDKNQVAKVARHLGFTAHEVDKINSIRKGKGYRELFIKQGDVGKVYCLEVCPHLDAVLSSKPVERNYLRELTKRYNGNIHFAVDQYIEDKLMLKGGFAKGAEKKGVANE